MKNIPVKIDKIYVWVLIISILFVLFSVFIQNIFLWILWLLAFIFTFVLTFNLKYFIENEKFIIKFFHLKKEVEIKEITKVRNFEEKFTKGFNYSLSFSGKIKIFYWKKDDFVIVSPKNKKEFLENLVDINDWIDLDL